MSGGKRQNEIDARPADDGKAEQDARLLASCYDEMRKVARRLLAQNQLRFVFQPTDLANEASIRLIRSDLSRAVDGGHLLAIAARAMRQIIIDEARRLGAAKRAQPLLLTRWPDDAEDEVLGLDVLDDALARLAALSPERAQVVELRFMMGLSVEETARLCGVSARTVKRQWQAARAWLVAFGTGRFTDE